MDWRANTSANSDALLLNQDFSEEIIRVKLIGQISNDKNIK
jgi:hypothetical protein